MKWLKLDINRGNTIIDVSGAEYDNLKSNEIQVSTEFDFPTSQPYIFYKWDESLGSVVVNDEEKVIAYTEESGGLTGLDLEPFIDYVHDAELLPSTTKIITIEGLNFSPFSTVEISGDGNFTNTVYFISPKIIKAEITVGMDVGLYNIFVKNDQLSSKESGYNMLIIKDKTVVDLRSEDILNLGLEMSNGIDVEQDLEKGLRFYSNSSSWNRGVKFSNYTWNRNDNHTFEMVFTRTSDVLFMCGIGSTSLDVESINSAYYKQEIGIYHNNNTLTTVYGGGDVTNWNQSIGTVINFEKNIFYKLKFENSGGINSNCGIYEVDVNNWDDEVLLHSWKSDCVSDDIILTPFVLPQAKSGSYYITGFRF